MDHVDYIESLEKLRETEIKLHRIEKRYDSLNYLYNKSLVKIERKPYKPRETIIDTNVVVIDSLLTKVK